MKNNLLYFLCYLIKQQHHWYYFFFFFKLSADSLLQWRAEGKVAVWLRVPISLSRCAAAASTHGFAFHHAKDDHAVLALWLGEGESRLPGFATHQVGVAGRDLWDESSLSTWEFVVSEFDPY